MENKDLKNGSTLEYPKNRFVCNYDNCRRILSKGGTESFPCTSCGHGMMRLIKPMTYCVECGEPIYGNITPSNEKAAFYKGHDFIDVTCSKCVNEKVGGIIRWEKLLHTKFIDTDDYDEKIALYEATVRGAKEINADISKIRVKTLGSRLRALRRKLGLTLAEMAEFLNLQSKSTISQYEKDVRKIPDDIKNWLKAAESAFKHLGREKGVKQTLLGLANLTKSLKVEKGGNLSGESSQIRAF